VYAGKANRMIYSILCFLRLKPFEDIKLFWNFDRCGK
jgi:hypothetical protein